MADHIKVEATKKQVEAANKLWSSFVVGGKWAIIATCVVVALLGIVFIDW